MNNLNMRILQLCHKPPFPPTDGGSIAMFNLASGLHHIGEEVHILAMNTHKQRCEPDQIPNPLQFARSYQLVEVDIRIKLLPAFLNLFSTESYNISRFQSVDFEAALVDLLKKYTFNFIILESLFSTCYLEKIRSLHNGIIVLRSHNVEFKIWQNLASNERNPLRKWYLKLLARRLKKYELQKSSMVDVIASISKNDIGVMEALECNTKMVHLPFGINLTEFESVKPALSSSNIVKLYHVGSMNWLPHQEGLKWFFEKIWSKLKPLYPKIELHLAGTEMPEWMVELDSENVFITEGYVDGKSFSNGKDIKIVPSFSGSGIRVKIIEAMAMEKAIITTHNGAMGIDCNHLENIYISDDPSKWVEYITQLVESDEQRKLIGQNAKKFIEKNHDYIELSQKIRNDLLKISAINN